MEICLATPRWICIATPRWMSWQLPLGCIHILDCLSRRQFNLCNKRISNALWTTVEACWKYAWKYHCFGLLLWFARMVIQIQEALRNPLTKNSGLFFMFGCCYSRHSCCSLTLLISWAMALFASSWILPRDEQSNRFWRQAPERERLRWLSESNSTTSLWSFLWGLKKSDRGTLGRVSFKWSILW